MTTAEKRRAIPTHAQCVSSIDRVQESQFGMLSEQSSYLVRAARHAREADVYLGRCVAYEELGTEAPPGYVAIAIDHLEAAIARLRRGPLTRKEIRGPVLSRIALRGVLPTDQKRLGLDGPDGEI